MATLVVAIVLASGLQAATGIGFGVIAGPVLLLVLDSHTAIQISIALSLLIGVVLTPTVWRSIEWSLLPGLLLGTLIGIPFGLGVFLLVDLYWLKFLAGLTVLWTFFFALLGGRRRAPAAQAGDGLTGQSVPSNAAPYLVGSVSGLMSGILAMPGPVVAAWMSGMRYAKDTIRATILAMFLFSYVAAFAMQAASVGVTAITLRQIGMLALPTLLGVLAGYILARQLSECLFRKILLTILAATALSLFVSAVPNLLGRI